MNNGFPGSFTPMGNNMGLTCQPNFNGPQPGHCVLHHAKAESVSNFRVYVASARNSTMDPLIGGTQRAQNQQGFARHVEQQRNLHMEQERKRVAEKLANNPAAMPKSAAKNAPKSAAPAAKPAAKASAPVAKPAAKASAPVAKPAAKASAPAAKPAAKTPAPAAKPAAKNPAPAAKPAAKTSAPAAKPAAKTPAPAAKPAAKASAPAAKPAAKASAPAAKPAAKASAPAAKPAAKASAPAAKPAAKTPAPAAKPAAKTPAPVAKPAAKASAPAAKPAAKASAPAAKPVAKTPAPAAKPAAKTPAPVAKPAAKASAPAAKPAAKASAPAAKPVAKASAPAEKPAAKAPDPAVKPAANPPAQKSDNSLLSTLASHNFLSHEQQVQKSKEIAECQTALCKMGKEAQWAVTDLAQGASFAAGIVAGVPAGLYETVDGIVKTASNPAEAYSALKALSESGNILGNLGSAVKQSWADSIDRMEAEYQKGSVSGAFNAGVEGGKLTTDIGGLVTGGVGLLKSGAVAIEKSVVKAASKTDSVVKTGADMALPQAHTTERMAGYMAPKVVPDTSEAARLASQQTLKNAQFMTVPPLENPFLGKGLIDRLTLTAPQQTKVAEQLLDIGIKASITGITAMTLKDVADRITTDELSHITALSSAGNPAITGDYLSSLQDKYAPAHTGNTQLPDTALRNTGGHQPLVAQTPGHTGNHQIPVPGAMHTGNTAGVTDTGIKTTITPIPDGPGMDNLAYLAGGYEPNKGAVGNIGEFFTQSGFGSEIKGLSTKTSKQYQGQSVYKATDSIGSFIKPGDQFYLDARHKNHLEVFDRTGTKVQAVLNLDGSYNDKKTKAARDEGRKLPK